MSATDTGPGGRIEADLEQPIKPVTRTHRGLLAGAPLGVVAVLVLTSVAFGASVVRVAIEAAAAPTAALVDGTDPRETATATVEPTATSTAERRPSASTRPVQPTPATPVPVSTAPAVVVDMGALTVADNLDMTVSFGWNAFTGSRLTAYALVYESTSTGRTPTFPTSQAWGTAGADRVTLMVPGIPAGDYLVRLQALCGGSELVVCGQTSATHVHLSAGRGTTPPAAPTPARTAPPATHAPTAPADGVVLDMGALTVTDNVDRTITFSWHAYTGGGLNGYAVFAEDYASGKLPTYPISTAWRTAPSTRTSVSMTPASAGTFSVRVQALCGRGAGLRVCGQTAVVRIHLSQATYGSPIPTLAPTPAPATPGSTPA